MNKIPDIERYCTRCGKKMEVVAVIDNGFSSRTGLPNQKHYQVKCPLRESVYFFSWHDAEKVYEDGEEVFDYFY